MLGGNDIVREGNVSVMSSYYDAVNVVDGRAIVYIVCTLMIR